MKALQNTAICWLILIVVSLLVSGCDWLKSDDANLTGPIQRPNAFFTFQVVETSSEFIVSFTNQSTNSEGTTRDLTYRWTFEGEAESTLRNPSDRRWTKRELNIAEPGESASRAVTLVVVEDNDASKRSEHNETIIFEIEDEEVEEVSMAGSGAELLATLEWQPFLSSNRVFIR